MPFKKFIMNEGNKPFKILTTIGDICQDFILHVSHLARDHGVNDEVQRIIVKLKTLATHTLNVILVVNATAMTISRNSNWRRPSVCI